jgi:hypothetical protein
MSEYPYALDLGHEHYLSWVIKTDEGPRIGATIEHTKPDGEPCLGGISWASSKWEEERGLSGFKWKLESPEADEHITVSPSILCSCGDHGFIRDGKWVPA